MSLSSLRSQRFSDTEYNSSPRHYDVPNPLASKTPPSDFNQVKNLLAQELTNSWLYNDTWIKATDEFKIKKLHLPSKYFQSSTPEECYIAVIAYSLETNLYKDFNRKFRQLNGEAAWNRFPYKSFYYLLVLAVPGIKNYPNPESTLYRGIRNYQFPRAPRVGDDFYFDNFASSTTDFTTAFNLFMGQKGTMIVIRNGAEAAMGINNYSPFDEDEVLILPCNTFKVVSFKRNGPVDVLELERGGFGALEAVLLGVGVGVLGVATIVGAVLANIRH